MVLPDTAGSPDQSPLCPVPKTFRLAFEQASGKTGISFSLLVAVAQVESGFHPDAVSRAGARGLLQVLPSTARELNIDLGETRSDVLAGASYLNEMLHRYDTVELALAAYNAGPAAVDRAAGIPSAETRHYVRRVLSQWHRIAGCS